MTDIQNTGPEISPLMGATFGAYNYTLDTVFTAPTAALGAGVIRTNNATAQSVTSIWVAYTTAAPVTNLQSFITNIAVGDTIVLQDKNDPTIWQKYLVTATAPSFGTNQAFTVRWLLGGKPLVPGNAILFGDIPGLVTPLAPAVVTPSTVPPSAPGQPYPIYASGSPTSPATPIPSTGSPIIPPPTIGNPVGVPTFPPPTPPPIGLVPAGPLVGPAVAPAPVPPSIAGQPLISFKTGSATSPPANGYFPLYYDTPYAGFPNQPPNGVPLVFANIYTGNNPQITPPSTATTAAIILNGWGPPGPSGLGPGPPTYPNPPGAGLPHVASEIRVGDAESPERSGDTVFSAAHIAQLHQSEPPPNSRRKRMPARHAAGGGDLS